MGTRCCWALGIELICGGFLVDGFLPQVVTALVLFLHAIDQEQDQEDGKQETHCSSCDQSWGGKETAISLGQCQTTSDITKSAPRAAAPRAASSVPVTVCAGTSSSSRCYWGRPGLLPVWPQNNHMFHINQFELIFQFSPKKKCWQDVLPVQRQNKKKNPTQKRGTTTHMKWYSSIWMFC